MGDMETDCVIGALLCEDFDDGGLTNADELNVYGTDP